MYAWVWFILGHLRVCFLISSKHVYYYYFFMMNQTFAEQMMFLNEMIKTMFM